MTLLNKDSILIIGNEGGCDAPGLVHELNLSTKSLCESEEDEEDEYGVEGLWPELEEGRNRHSTTVLGSSVYIFGGYNGETQLDSIESLDTIARISWKKFTIRGFTARQATLVAPVNNSQILVAGGFDRSGKYLSEVLLINPERKTLRVLD